MTYRWEHRGFRAGAKERDVERQGLKTHSDHQQQQNCHPSNHPEIAMGM